MSLFESGSISTKIENGACSRPLIPEETYLYALAALCALSAALYSTFLSAGHGWGDDFGAYLMLARNLQQGRPYSYLTPDMGTMVPPGFPFLMSLWSHVSGWDFIKLKSVNVFAWSLLAPLSYRLARFNLTAASSFAVAVAVLCCPFFILAEQEIISDMPYVVIITACLCLSMINERDMSFTKSYAAILGVALLVFVAFLIRPATVALVAALLVHQFYVLLDGYWRRRKLYVRALATMAILLLTTALVIFLFPGPFEMQGANAIANKTSYVFSLRSSEEFNNFRVIFFGFIGVKWPAIVLLVVGFGGIIMEFWTTRKLTPLHFFIVTYSSMILLTPWNGGPRYLFPVIPIIFVLVAAFCEKTSAFVKLPAGGQLAAVIILLMISANGAHEIYLKRGYVENDVGEPKAVELFQWIAGNTNSDSVLCAFKPRAFLFITQRRTIHIGFDRYQGTGTQFLSALGCNYAVLPTHGVIGSLYDKVLDQVVADSTLKQVFNNGKYLVFQPTAEPLSNKSTPR